MARNSYLPFVSLIALLMLLPARAVAQELSGYVTAETRAFPSGPLAGEQHNNTGSMVLEPEWYHAWDRGDQSITFVPFLRLDLGDAARTHFDIREFYWQKAARSWELKVGLAKVFWGVTEAQHLVDIINQTDLVEQPDGEDKLGQPMVNFTWIKNWGVVDVFVLPWFRERTFPGRQGRLRGPLPVDTDQADMDRRVDLAARWSHTLGDFDVGVAHFYGTSREPRLLPGLDEAARPVLIPRYDVIHQTSLDVQYTTGAWLWKLETITRSGQDDRFLALTGGFEYTFSNVRNSGIDLGLLVEYLYDGRDKIAFGGRRLSPVPFEDDVFFGARLAFNDVQSTDVLGGVIIDRDTGASAVRVEARRRLRDRWTADLEFGGFLNTSDEDQLYGLRKDSYLQLGLSYHF